MKHIREKNYEFPEFNLQCWFSQIPPMHWIFHINIMSILEVEFLRVEEISRWKKINIMMFIREEFSCDSIFEKLFLSIVSSYCISTELRFL